ncbi:hypothetical protein Prudu_008984, partial [Prunus dulcis]
QEEHPRAVSAVEDGEGHSGCTDERHRAAPTAELLSSLATTLVIRTTTWRTLTKSRWRNVNRLFSERYKQWKSDLHHHFEAFDDPQVALQEGCAKELEGQEDSWAWLCTHFQAPTFVNKAKVNKGNRKKKTLLHHSGSRPFSYKMDARRGSKFPEIDVFGDVYVRPGNELAESLYVNDDGGNESVGSSGVHLPISSRYSDRVCGSFTGCWVSNLDGEIVPFDNVIWAIPDPSIRSAGPDMDALTTVAMARIFVSQTAQLLIRSFKINAYIVIKLKN